MQCCATVQAISTVENKKRPNFEWRGGGRPGVGVLPYKRLMGMCHWMGSHFYDWIDYNGVTFSIELLEWGCTFSDFLGVTQFFIFTVSK